jgi:iron complex outermembrane receptor protein
MGRQTFKAALAVTVALSAIGAGAPALAQTAPTTAQDSANKIEDIIVTARRREESLQSAPVAISALSQGELESARVERLADLAKVAPGLTFTPLFGAQNQLPIIRGAAQTFGQLNVGVFLDGVYLSGKAGADLEMADLERIEVVRGPQSALYGQNTFAGAINYITQRPTAVLTGDIEGTVGSDGLRKLTAGLSGPITDTLGFRIGAYKREFDGFYTSAIDGGRVDFSDTSGGMLTLDYAPNERFSAILRLTGSTEDSGQPASVTMRNNAFPATPSGAYNGTPPTGNPAIVRNLLYVGELGPIDKDEIYVNTRRTSNEVGDYGTRQDLFRASLTMDYDFGPVTLTSITSNSEREAEYTYDGDNTICDRAGGCPNFGWPFAPSALIPAGTSGLATSSADESFTDFTQELRLTSNSAGPVSWLVGAYYYDGRWDTTQRSLSGFANPAVVTAFGFPRMITDTKSLSIFGSVTYDFSERLSGTLELRHQEEDQTYRQGPTNTAASDAASTAEFDLEKSFQFTTPRAILKYEIDADKMVYASVARGAKTGGFNTNINIAADQRTFEPEYSWNYEVGGKFDWSDSLRTNIAAFYTDWTDQQTACQNPVSFGGNSTQRTYTCNVASSTIWGLELDGTWRLNENFSVTGSYAWTRARYDSFVDDSLAATLVLLGQPAWDFEGRHLPYVPDHKLTISPRYTVHAFGDYDFEGRLDVQHQSRTYVRADNMQSFGEKTTVDLRLALTSDTLDWRFFVNNLFDDDTPVAAVRFYDATNYSVASPLVTAPDRRLIGLSVGYEF